MGKGNPHLYKCRSAVEKPKEGEAGENGSKETSKKTATSGRGGKREKGWNDMRATGY